VLSVGAGWHPGRHLFPKPAWRLVAVDPDPNRPKIAVEGGEADDGFPGLAGELDALPDGSFDVVLYRLVLHHVVFQQPLAPVFAEAARLLRPGGALVAIEPGLWHPVGAALALANRLGLGVAVHGTPDDVPLSPRTLVRKARGAGLQPELHAVSYAWRRLPRPLQAAAGALDGLGSLPVARSFGHTVMLIARRP
jgi:SAM-dependent methyltransferase